MLRNILLILFILGSSPAFCYTSCLNLPGVQKDDPLSCWQASVKTNLIDAYKGKIPFKSQQQAFCYIDEYGEIRGDNHESLLSIASVSKIFTTLWALYQLGEDYQFKTKVHIKKISGSDQYEVHIEGGQDPIFERKSIYQLMQKLNAAGISRISQLSFDSKFYFLPEAIDTYAFYSLNDQVKPKTCTPYLHTQWDRSKQATYLKRYLNTYGWNSIATETTVDCLNGKNKFNGKNMTIFDDFVAKRPYLGGNTSKPNLIVDSVVQSQQLPFNPDQTLIIKSKPLNKIVKEVNTHSLNLPADLLYLSLGGIKKFNETYKNLAQQSGLQFLADFTMYSGSGLRFKENFGGGWRVKEINGVQLTNRANCRTVLTIASSFLNYNRFQQNYSYLPFIDEYLVPSESVNISIPSNFLAVAGEGTLHGYSGTAYQKKFVAKTGTVGDGTSLTGIINTSKGKIPFSIINNFDGSYYQSAKGETRNFQKSFLSDFFNVLSRSTVWEQGALIQYSGKASRESFNNVQSMEWIK